MQRMNRGQLRRAIALDSYPSGIGAKTIFRKSIIRNVPEYEYETQPDHHAVHEGLDQRANQCVELVFTSLVIASDIPPIYFAKLYLRRFQWNALQDQ